MRKIHHVIVAMFILATSQASAIIPNKKSNLTHLKKEAQKSKYDAVCKILLRADLKTGSVTLGSGSGTFISDRHILTAAHVMMIPNFPKKTGIKKSNVYFQVVTHIQGKNGKLKKSNHKVKSYIIHPKYKKESKKGVGVSTKYDLALIKLEKPVNSIRPLALTNHVSQPIFSNCYSVGFGKTKNSEQSLCKYKHAGLSPTVLTERNLGVLTSLCHCTSCKRIHKKHINATRYRKHANKIKSMGKSLINKSKKKCGRVCSGDSGGALLDDGQLIGVTSAGVGINKSKKPTKKEIKQHHKFIKKYGNGLQHSSFFCPVFDLKTGKLRSDLTQMLRRIGFKLKT